MMKRAGNATCAVSRYPLASDAGARSARRQHCIGLPRASTPDPRPRARAGHRRQGWATAQDRDTAAARSATQGDHVPKET
jgi:hypothetical protein